jgi:hypothetical protein
MTLTDHTPLPMSTSRPMCKFMAPRSSYIVSRAASWRSNHIEWSILPNPEQLYTAVNSVTAIV